MNGLFDSTPPPTRVAALAAIDRVRPAAYARTRNRLDGAVTGLSPYITHGIVTLREVLERIDSREPLAVQHKLVFELGWRAYFRHVWQHRGDAILHSLHGGPRPDASYAATLPNDIREARTGLAVIDEAVRTLYATGGLHNHARMWLASYVVHLRHVHWRAGADWMIAHLLDGDLASNHLSWQWVAGTSGGRHYLFDAANVARNAPPPWHVPDSVLDVPYATLDRISRDGPPLSALPARAAVPTAEPTLHTVPPATSAVMTLDSSRPHVAGRAVWLVHPWALREPPPHVPAGALRIGIYPREHHAMWPWTSARWQWVDAAMRGICETRWLLDSNELAAVLRDAERASTTADPHVDRWLPASVRMHMEPPVFPEVDRHCTSFSQWWKRATRGLRHAHELIRGATG